LLLDYIAECVDTFLTEQGLEDQETELNLGYTFSFPVLQSKVKKFKQYKVKQCIYLLLSD
jgi:hexokinase